MAGPRNYSSNLDDKRAMAGGKNNTERIETLEKQAFDLFARLAVHDSQIDAERLNKVPTQQKSIL